MEIKNRWFYFDNIILKDENFYPKIPNEELEKLQLINVPSKYKDLIKVRWKSKYRYLPNNMFDVQTNSKKIPIVEIICPKYNIKEEHPFHLYEKELYTIIEMIDDIISHKELDEIDSI